MTIASGSTLSSLMLAGLLAGCAEYTPTPFTPAHLDTSAYVAKVDAFVVVLDTSDSMNFYYADRTQFLYCQGCGQRYESDDSRAWLQVCACRFCSDSIFTPEDVRVVYGPATYRSADFARGLSTLESADGLTPMAKGIDVGGETVTAASRKVALILVSDFWHIDDGAVNAVVDNLKAEYGDRLCIHTIKVGNTFPSDDLPAALAGVNSCGTSVDAASLASPDAMAEYVTDVLLKPAAVRAAAVKYEKNTVSASALFDHDKAELKEEGQTALHALDQSIKARGVNLERQGA